MKKVLLLIIFCSVYLYSASGIWQTYVVISLNGGGNSFYAGSTNPDNGTRWDAVNLGTITSTTTLVLKGGEVKTFKNGGSDVTGAKLFYRVYKDGNTPGSYSDMTLPWVQDLGGGDQKWQRTDGTVDLQDQMTSEGTWKIEIYWEAYTNIDGTHQNTGGGLKSVTGDNSLPVELISFSIKVVNNNIALNWQTATEINNFGFEVERSTDKSNWSKIGFVQGAGNSNSPKNYSYTDNTAVSGKYFYRLKQVDTDGTFDYSPVVEVDMGILPGGYRLEQNYPNPFNPSTSIKFAFSKDTKAAIKVYNALGVEVREIYNGIAEAGRVYDIKFNAAGLSSGVYYYKLITPEKTDVRKMMLTK